MNNILKMERGNSGQSVHCHYQQERGAWIAYGKSAYALQHIVRDAGLHTIDRYSTEMNMACVMVGSNTLNKVCCHAEVEKHEDYLCINYATTFSNEEYAGWVELVKSASAKKNNRWVQTVVSDIIADEQHIKDGMSAMARYLKRAADIIFSLVAIILFAPLILITYILVRAEDGGPAIYKQERVGRFGRPFHIYKFRSMRIDAERDGPQLSHGGAERDNRLTKIGKFIRAHHLDELPQLWNVLRGDMTFIGPRPERRYYIEQIMEYDKRYTLLYQIRPGVTSYATLYNGYTDTMEKMLRRLELDLYYLENRSSWLDIKILWNTFSAIVFGNKF